jgi:hypothetical protein
VGAVANNEGEDEGADNILEGHVALKQPEYTHDREAYGQQRELKSPEFESDRNRPQAARGGRPRRSAHRSFNNYRTLAASAEFNGGGGGVSDNG